MYWWRAGAVSRGAGVRTGALAFRGRAAAHIVRNWSNRMAAYLNLYMFRSTKSEGLCGFSRNSSGQDLPDKFAPWQGFGVVRNDQQPPHGLSRKAIETGIDTNGYQLWRSKKKA